MISLAPAASILILTGAGISRESGLHTFRDADGIWATVRIEDVATPEAFQRDPVRVHEFYNARRRQLHDPAVRPNEAHRALAELERAWPGRVTLVTQNIDDLHERGGSAAPIHMHGQIDRVFCVSCGHRADWRGELTIEDSCPSCGLPATLRVDVVWFGEMPYHMERIMAALADCDLFVSIGTSGTVYPAAGFVSEAALHGAHTLQLNLEETGGRFDESRQGPATILVPELVRELLHP